MAHVRPLLLLATIFAAAANNAMATTPTSDGTTLPPVPDALELPPLPSPAVPACLQELAVCASVYQDSSKLAPCCSSVKKVFKSDKACICSALGEAQKALEQLKQQQQPGMNATALDGLEMFRQCKMPTDSCDPAKPAGSQNVGNAAPGARSIGRFDIMLLLPLFFLL